MVSHSQDLGGISQWFWDNTLWLFNIAMENGPFIDGLPIKNGDFPWLCEITRWYPLVIERFANWKLICFVIR
jgi:hypothetical protein